MEPEELLRSIIIILFFICLFSSISGMYGYSCGVEKVHLLHCKKEYFQKLKMNEGSYVKWDKLNDKCLYYKKIVRK